ncbi:MAG: EAL domain-containing protein [Burkholderiales bacterium]|nr:EAL domain-containing protein [Burkholderiales bacterium]
MPRYHSLLLRQLMRLGIEDLAGSPTAEQWQQLLERISSAYAELESAQPELSSAEVRELNSRIEEAQRIAGLGDWAFDRLTRKSSWSRECCRIFGLTSSDPMPTYRELMRRVHQDDRLYVKDRVEAAMHDARKFEIEFRYLLPNGHTRWLRAIGQPIKDPKGSVCRLVGTVMDVNSRKLIELRQSMEHTIARLLAECDAPLEIVPEIIQTICETFSWVCGALWTLDKKSSALKRITTWSIHKKEIEDFFHCTENIIEVPGTALTSRTLRVANPLWLPDPSRGEHFQRAKHASEAGIYAALSFPVQAAGETLGIMEFFSNKPEQIDKDTLQSAHFVGRHIGQFFQRKQAEEALRESEAHFRALVEQASDSLYVNDVNGDFIDVNQQGCEGLGYTRDELLRMNIRDIDIDITEDELEAMTAQITAGERIARESRYRRKDGALFPVEVRIGPIEINGRKQLLSLARDVTERKRLQDHIQHLAYHDPLTDLPNRAMFNRHLSHAISHAKRQNKGLAVLFIDLDRFKNINDTLGHDAGDRLLQEMAQRLADSLRDSDLVARLDSRDMVARLGGDEFVVLLEDVDDSSQAGHVAQKILSSILEEYLLDGQLIHITASIGISVFPEDGADEFTLMKHADIAMYRAKEKGKNNFQFYSAQMALHSARQLALESSLRRGLERNELVLHYQAKVDSKSGAITGAEALVRWQHPELGLLHPSHFIPMAEETGLIVPLSKWVIREACMQHRLWGQQQLPDLTLAVNLSPRQFLDDQLYTDIAATLNEFEIDPTLIELEITESMMMHSPEKTVQILGGLKSMGIRIAIDDFGIGYSSLSHLKKFPIDTVKIDRSFIQDVPGDRADEAITEAIIAMGKSLKIKVVAEGVETMEQLQFLSRHGCDEIQGYFFSKPTAAEEFTKLLWENQARYANVHKLPAA